MNDEMDSTGIVAKRVFEIGCIGVMVGVFVLVWLGLVYGGIELIQEITLEAGR